MFQQPIHSETDAALELRTRSRNLRNLEIGTFAYNAEHRRVIELLSADPRGAAAAPVDHRNPIHDQFCRCRACKPAPVASDNRARTAVAVFALGGLFWSAILYSAFA